MLESSELSFRLILGLKTLTKVDYRGSKASKGPFQADSLPRIPQAVDSRAQSFDSRRAKISRAPSQADSHSKNP